MTAGKVEIPFHVHRDAVGEIDPAGQTLTEAVRYALDDLRIFGHHGTLSAGGPHTPLRGRALLVSLSPGTVLVVGVSSLAHAVRELFAPDGFTSWHLATLPTTRTPLHHLKPHLLTKQYNVLSRRYEFATVEEVATVPNDVWPEMAAVGPSLLHTLETALTTVPRQDPPRQVEHTTTAAPTGQHGWHLEVLADGTRASVHAPSPVALTGLSGTTVHLAQTTGTAEPAKAAENGQPEPELVWNTEVAEQILRRAQPAGSVLLRALIDEGGTATAERLRERTGLEALHHATQSLTTAAAAVLEQHHPEGRSHRYLVTARSHTPDGRVYDYQLPEHLIPVFSAALDRLGR